MTGAPSSKRSNEVEDSNSNDSKPNKDFSPCRLATTIRVRCCFTATTLATGKIKQRCN